MRYLTMRAINLTVCAKIFYSMFASDYYESIFKMNMMPDIVSLVLWLLGLLSVIV